LLEVVLGVPVLAVFPVAPALPVVPLPAGFVFFMVVVVLVVPVLLFCVVVVAELCADAASVIVAATKSIARFLIVFMFVFFNCERMNPLIQTQCQLQIKAAI
jgi:hypothetical protein